MFWRHLVEPRATVSPTVLRMLTEPVPVELAPLPEALAPDGWRDVLVLHPTHAGHDARLDLETPAELYDLLSQLAGTSTWRQVGAGLQGRYAEAEITRMVRLAFERRWVILLGRKARAPLDLLDFLHGSGLLPAEHLQTLKGPGTALAMSDPEMLGRLVVERGWLSRGEAGFLKKVLGFSQWSAVGGR